MRVIICDPVDEKSIQAMKEISGIEVDVKTGMTPDELKACVGDYDIMIVRSATKAKADVIAKCKNMKLILRGGVGLDNIDVEAAEKAGIKVDNTPAASSISVAELAFAEMLALARHISHADASMKAKTWEKKKFNGTELYKKTLGIIGIGRIGQELAKRALAFDMKVLAYDVIIDKIKLPAGVQKASLDELLAKADYISLHVPFDKEKGALLSVKEFAMMKDGVYLVNCSRGGVVDEKALADALKSGKVKAAAVDVFAKEPPDADNPLYGLDNIILSPHIGASTKEGQARVGGELVSKIREFAGK
ncbi:3-phosphoglycerate dehydrogenase [bacterium]|nr:3-phosphoglycerate dehydrogenase [bacterium]